MKLVCYGAGKAFERVKDNFIFQNVELIAVLDKNIGKPYTSSCGEGKTVSPEAVSTLEFDYILICSDFYYEEMHQFLLDRSIEESKIIFADLRYCNKEVTFFHNLNRIFLHGADVSKSVLKACTHDVVFDLILTRDVELSRNRLIKSFYEFVAADYVRYSTIELMADRIKKQNVKGCIAELGVFRGDTASFLSKLFQERDLYLFDTFEGFDKNDIDVENTCDVKTSKVDFNSFKDTSVNLVMSRMEHKEKVHCKKGRFPDTLVGIPDNIEFAFVSLDVDIYQPTYEGLKYFYPKLSVGGYIIVHDYEGKAYPGAKLAVDKFCEEYKVNFVPCSDIYGSVIFTKQVMN